MGYVDSTGLALFKAKQDLANVERFAQKSEIGSVYTYKGSVENKDALPKSGASVGDVYDTQDTGMNYAWTGSAWDALGTTIEVDAALSTTSTNPVQNKAVKTALDGKASTAAVSDSANGLMTPTQKKKLDGIQDDANAYSHPTVNIGAKTSDLYKVATDNMGHVTGATKVTKEDITALGIPGEITGTPVFKGATTNSAGVTGTVPVPTSGDTDAILCSNGTWMQPMTDSEIEALFK